MIAITRTVLLAGCLGLAAGAAYGSMTGVETNAGGGWHSSNTLVSPFNWTVTKNPDNSWTYQYKFGPSSIGRGVTFVNLEVGGNPTQISSSTVAANPNPGYLDPTLSTHSPAYAQWTTAGAGSSQTWTTYNYLDLTYTFDWTSNYSTADPATLDKQVPIVSQPYTIDRRPNSFTSSKVSYNGSPTPQYETGGALSGNVTTTMHGLTWFLPSQEYGVPEGSGASAGGGREPGTARGYNAWWDLTVTTPAAPMWGDVFLDGGDWKSDGKYLQATNAGYDSVAPAFTYLDGQTVSETGFVPVPDFTTILDLAIVGSGTVNDLSGSGFYCEKTDCAGGFPSDTVLTLHASPSAGYGFDGWRGACTGTGDCVVTIDQRRQVAAEFGILSYLRTGGVYYAKLQDGVNAAASGGTVQARALSFTEALTFDRAGVPVLLKGGYDSGFATDGGYTAVDGTLVVKNGTLRVERVKIR